MKIINITLLSSLLALLALSGCESNSKEPSTVKTKADVTKALAKLNETSQEQASKVKSVVHSANIEPKLVTSNISSITSYTPIWSKAKGSTVMLYPQKTVQSIDKKSNDRMDKSSAIQARAKVIYNDTDLAVMIRWKDSDKTRATKDLSSFADGIAMQFAVNYSNANKLPYVGMGSSGRAVVIHLQKEGIIRAEPNGHNDVQAQQNDNGLNIYRKELKAYKKKVAKNVYTDYEKMFISEGFRSLSEIKDGTATGKFTMRYEKGNWIALLIRPLKDKYVDLHAQSFPITFAVWDGKQANRGSSKYLSSWITVGKKSSDFAKIVSGVPKGDIHAGKLKAVEHCAGCHNFDDRDNGMPYMAPNMSNIGGQATASYIKESIVDPSAVIVPGYNRNAHRNFAWYDVVNGKRVSTMPAFEWMAKKDVDDLVAYFKTLK